MSLRYDKYLYININVIYYRYVRFLTIFSRSLCYLSVILFALNLSAQNQKKGFSAELMIGANFSQLDGDGLNGFDRVGAKAGIDIAYPTSVNMDWALGIYYEQRGSSSGIFFSGVTSQFIHLNYVALPISLRYGHWWYQDYDRYKITVAPRLTPARLLTTKSSHASFDNATEQFKEWDVSIGIEAIYAIGRNSNISLSIDRSLLKIYEIPNTQLSALQSYWISIGYRHSLK